MSLLDGLCMRSGLEYASNGEEFYSRCLLAAAHPGRCQWDH